MLSAHMHVLRVCARPMPESRQLTVRLLFSQIVGSVVLGDIAAKVDVPRSHVWFEQKDFGQAFCVVHVRAPASDVGRGWGIALAVGHHFRAYLRTAPLLVDLNSRATPSLCPFCTEPTPNHRSHPISSCSYFSGSPTPPL